MPYLAAGAALLAWQISAADPTLAFTLASPRSVAEEFLRLVGNGTLFTHLLVTLLEIALGFTGGVLLALLGGYGIANSRLLESLLGPYAVGFQAVPMIAIAPILIRFFGPGIPTNATICGLIVFFPMLISTIVGLRGIDSDQRAILHSLTATRWQMFRLLELPAAFPTILGGLKISTTLAVVGAVVGEAFAAQAGLGYLIYASRFVYNSAGVFVAVFTLTALAITLYQTVAWVERHTVQWRRANELE
ncbi:MAG: ABC transporter permease [Anaerolineales bacterium]|nr:ABC transporter permease [Anaerolineales bacterium]